MAEIGFVGLDDLMLSMEEIAQIPDDVKDEMLNAMADVLVPSQQAKARAYGVEDTGLLISSIKKGEPKLKKDTRVIYVYPQGSRTRVTRDRKTGEKKVTKVRNAEIAFINEYGDRRQKARPFIRDANEACAEATTQAGFEVYDKWLKSKNL